MIGGRGVIVYMQLLEQRERRTRSNPVVNGVVAFGVIAIWFAIIFVVAFLLRGRARG